MTRSRRGFVARFAAGLLTAIVMSLSVSTVASAHTEMTSSSPASGAILEAAPGQIELSFGQPVEAATSSIGVKDAAGASFDNGKPFTVRNSANVVGVGLKPGARGVLTVTWRITAMDGHPMTGKYSFTAGKTMTTTTTTKPAPTTSAPDTSPETSMEPSPTTSPDTTTVETPTTSDGLMEPAQQVATTNASDVGSTPSYLPFFVVAMIVGVVAAIALRRRTY